MVCIGDFCTVIVECGGLGFLSRHFASLTGRKGLIENDLISVWANPRLRRFFLDEAPKKKNYEKYFPKAPK
ncbi:unnamed protein product [Eruca vesicaria subsp. sativa]|uniref:Uncharacterized protein n=1 Tax=Eruca vesicaria subsp. sativa TaxID=29727 RepID=A0ABC8JW58_ERUVS|nr:unnamed protein product [Eruca vesicaria subsp. sativa]